MRNSSIKDIAPDADRGAVAEVPHRLPAARAGLLAWLDAVAHRAFDTSSPGRIKPLEGTRGLSVLLVFLVHYDALFGSLAPDGSLTAYLSRFGGAMGNAGVDMFFIISGYLIYGAVLKPSMRLTRFLRRRVERIYPTFLCVFALYVIGAHLVPDAAKGNPRSAGYVLYLAENLLLLPGLLPITPIISVAWSLSFEFFFYITLPLVTVALGIRTWTRTGRVAFFASVGLLVVLLSALNLMSHVRLAMFIPGMLLYECAASGALDGWLAARGEKLAIALGVAGLLTVGWLEMANGAAPHFGRFAYCVPACRVVILSFSFSSVLLYSFRFDGILKRWFSWTQIGWLGNISYSYYLIHGGALHGFRALASPLLHGASTGWFWVLLPAGIAATVVATVPVFLLVEKRFSLRTPGSA